MDAFLGKPVRLARLAEVITQQVRDPRSTPGEAEHITDAALRQKLLTQFAAETAGLLAEMRAALAAADWPRLRSRAHYLKNSADVLGLTALQAACARLAAINEAPEVAAVHRFLEAIEAAIPRHLAPHSDLLPAAKP